MSDLFATYGPDVVTWVLAALGTLLSSYVFILVRSIYVREILQRCWIEVVGGVAEVMQVYTDAIKAGRADGTLTTNEKANAKTMAIQAAKENIGKKGLARLGRVIGIDVDHWLASKVEQAVAISKVKVAPAAVAVPVVPLPPQPA